MPTVPVYTHTTDTQTPQTQPAHAHPAVADEPVRRELAHAVKQELAQKGTVLPEFLDRFAAGHFSPEQANSPAGWDYAVLRRAAQRDAQTAARQQQARSLEEEASWLQQVGILTPDSSTLKTYLDLQLPAYQKQLEQAGVAQPRVHQTVEQLRQRTIEGHVARSLVAGDWKTAQQVFAQHAGQLADGPRERLAGKIRLSFARAQAKQAWQEASFIGRRSQDIRQEALARVHEPDEKLRDMIQQEITLQAQQELRREQAAKAALFEQLAACPAQERGELLASQDQLDEHEWAQACQAAQQAGTPATPKQQEWFVQHYFEESSDVAQAFEKGLCAARDYFVLQAAQHRRQSEADAQTERWLGRTIQTWMKKQHFDQPDISRAIYTVFSGAADDEGRLKIWNRIKSILTC